MAHELELQICNHCREAFIGPVTISCPECQTKAVLTDARLRRRIVELNKNSSAFPIVQEWDAKERDAWLVRRMVDILTYARKET
jgi:hypothetical protein